MQTNDGYVLKPVQSPPRGEREHSFFKRLFSSNDSDLNQDEIHLRNLLPTYRGSLIHNESKHIKMFKLLKDNVAKTALTNRQETVQFL